jgi:hypothetical protein
LPPNPHQERVSLLIGVAHILEVFDELQIGIRHGPHVTDGEIHLSEGVCQDTIITAGLRFEFGQG